MKMQIGGAAVFKSKDDGKFYLVKINKRKTATILGYLRDGFNQIDISEPDSHPNKKNDKVYQNLMGELYVYQSVKKSNKQKIINSLVGLKNYFEKDQHKEFLEWESKIKQAKEARNKETEEFLNAPKTSIVYAPNPIKVRPDRSKQIGAVKKITSSNEFFLRSLQVEVSPLQAA